MKEELIKRLRYHGERKDAYRPTSNVRLLLREAADALSRPAPTVQVPDGMALVPCDEATAASIWLTTCASNIEAGFSQWECDEMRRIAALLAAAPTPAPVATEAVAQGVVANAPCGGVDDVLRRVEKIICDCNMSDGKQAGGYLSLGDLRKVQATLASSPVVVDVEKVMALVEQYGQEKWNQGDNQYRRGCESSSTYYSEEAGRIRDRIRAMLASPAVPVGDGWMPIETAPKDGTVFLIGFNETARMRGARTVYEARWCTAQEKFTSVNGFVLFDGATNWRPLPPAPAATKEEA